MGVDSSQPAGCLRCGKADAKPATVHPPGSIMSSVTGVLILHNLTSREHTRCFITSDLSDTNTTAWSLLEECSRAYRGYLQPPIIQVSQTNGVGRLGHTPPYQQLCLEAPRPPSITIDDTTDNLKSQSHRPSPSTFSLRNIRSSSLSKCPTSIPQATNVFHVHESRLTVLNSLEP